MADLSIRCFLLAALFRAVFRRLRTSRVRAPKRSVFSIKNVFQESSRLAPQFCDPARAVAEQAFWIGGAHERNARALFNGNPAMAAHFNSASQLRSNCRTKSLHQAEPMPTEHLNTLAQRAHAVKVYPY